ARCLESIYRNPPPEDFEIIVVDNASRDGSVNMMREKFPQVRVLANADNKGFGPGCNQGIRAAEGEFIFLLNSDTEAFQDTFLSSFENHPPFGEIVHFELRENLPDLSAKPNLLLPETRLLSGTKTPENLSAS